MDTGVMSSIATAAATAPVVKKCGEAVGAMLAGQPRANVEKTEAEAYRIRVEGEANAIKMRAEAEGVLLKERSEAMVRLIAAGVDPALAAHLVGWGPATAGAAPLPVPQIVQALPPVHRPLPLPRPPPDG